VALYVTLEFCGIKRILLRGVFKRMYSDTAVELRRCTATCQDGTPCAAWAVWGDWQRRCIRHGGRSTFPPKTGDCATRYEPCRCVAYSWPHRPGGGLCRWPDPPRYRCTTPAGTHDWPRVRSRALRDYARMLKLSEMMIKRAKALGRARPSSST